MHPRAFQRGQALFEARRHDVQPRAQKRRASVPRSRSTRRSLHTVRLHQVNSLFLVQRAHGFGKKSENKTKKTTCTFQSLRPAGYSVVCGPEVHAFPPAPLHANRSTDAVMHWKVGKFVLWCSFSPQAKMPLVRVGIDLDREIALDWFVLQTQLQDQTFWSVQKTARIYHVEKIGNSKVLRSNSQFTSLSLASAKHGRSTRMEVSPGKRASVLRSFAVSLGLEWKLPDHKTAWLRVQMPLAHSWQVRPLIHALFRKDSCLSERNGSLEVAGVSSIV